MTIYPIIRLECDGVTTLLLDPNAGMFGQSLDLGDAMTRAVAEDATDADGTIDTTAYVGARSVTLSLIIYPDSGSLWALRQQLRAFTHPGRRPYMFIQQAADAPEQRITLRRSQYSDIIGDGPRAATQSDREAATITVQWIAPLGIIESAALNAASIFAAGGATAGRAYSLTFSRVYPASAALGTGTVVNAGTADSYPLLRIYGPMTEPVITNDTQGKSLAFTGLTLAAGEFLEIDTRAKTILLNGDTSASRYSKLSFPTSSWFTLSPGANVLRLHPATYTASTSLVEVSWRSAWL